MRKIMKKSLLLVIFTFVVVFGASYAFAALDGPFADDVPPPPGEVVAATGGTIGPGDGNDGDPDGYKEGWDAHIDPDTQCYGADEWESARARFIELLLFVGQWKLF